MRQRLFKAWFPALLFLLMAGLLTSARADDKDVYVAAVGGDGIQHVDMVGGSYFFKPAHVVVKVNVPVEISVRKEAGFVPHNIVMEEPAAGMVFNVKLKKSPTVIKFTPVQVGQFPFYCSKKLLFLKGHRAKGMEGVLEVVP